MMTARRAKIVALLAVLVGMTAMRGAAHEPPQPPIESDEFSANSLGEPYPSAAEWVPNDEFDMPIGDACCSAPSIPGSCDYRSLWMLRPPTHRYSFYAAFEAVSLAREIDENRVFATLNDDTTDVLNAEDLSFEQEAGMRFLLGARISKCFATEVAFITIANWDDAREVTDATINPAGTEGNLFSPFTNFGSPPEVGLDFNNRASLRLVSSLDTLEWNLRQRLTAPDTAPFAATAIYGFRYLAFDERLRYYTESTLPVPAGTFNTLDVVMNNHLYGFQLGGALDLRVAPFWVNLEGKAAICHNAILEEANFAGEGVGTPPNEPLDRIVEERATAFVGHVSATVELRLTEWCVARAGYQALFVDGLALASRSGPAGVLDDATATFHGPIAGVVLTW